MMEILIIILCVLILLIFLVYNFYSLVNPKPPSETLCPSCGESHPVLTMGKNICRACGNSFEVEYDGRAELPPKKAIFCIIIVGVALLPTPVLNHFFDLGDIISVKIYIYPLLGIFLIFVGLLKYRKHKSLYKK